MFPQKQQEAKKDTFRCLFCWCERRDTVLLRKPCILGDRCFATVPASDFGTKNSPPDCFLYVPHPLRLQVPHQQKKTPFGVFFCWCERRDLNPYGITTRPSNVRVCRFRHSRIFSFCPQRTYEIITKTFQYVNPFFKIFLKN